jgi:Flp pilus assembly protein TadD
MRIKSLLISILVLACLVSGAAWGLVTPDNPFSRLFRSEISDVEAPVIVGPYPSPDDIRLLSQHQVTTIVSLLNASLPYERVLLERERAAAARYDIQVLNFPMSSIFGQRFGSTYDESARNAAAAIASATGKVYLHCYLGMHRIETVKTLLAQHGTKAGTYSVRRGERDESARILDSAQAAYDKGRYHDAIDLISKIDRERRQASAMLLEAWSAYRLEDTARARVLFQQALQRALGAASPSAELEAGAAGGLGYCALRDQDYASAEKYFAQALTARNNDAEAMAGLGLTYYRQGRQDLASARLTAALQLDPGNDEIRQLLDRMK